MSRKPRAPDYRAQQVCESVEAGIEPNTQDVLTQYFFHFVKGEHVPDEDFLIAAELYSDEEYRHILNALLLGCATREQIHDGLAIGPRVLEHYAAFFFDASVFPHNPARIRYINNLQINPEFITHYRMAVERGPEEVIRRYRVGWRPKIQPKAITEQLVDDMTARFNTHRGQPITSDHAREALRWGEAALRGAKQLHDFAVAADDANRGGNDLRIALTVETLKSAPSEVGIDPDEVIRD